MSDLRGRATLRLNRFLIYPDKLTRRRIIVEEKEKGAANIGNTIKEAKNIEENEDARRFQQTGARFCPI